MNERLLAAERALSVGLADRAEQAYLDILAAEPRSSIAVVGLARVALERADDRRAYALARRALELDPADDAARRLVDRLAEVMLTRGERVPGGAEVAAVRIGRAGPPDAGNR